MKTLRLQNGARVDAYVGDGFDGGSGFYLKNKDPREWENPVVIPPRDRRAVAALLRWWIREEMKLRKLEGRTWKYLQAGPPTLTNPTSIYQAQLYLGYLEGWPKSQRDLRDIHRKHRPLI